MAHLIEHRTHTSECRRLGNPNDVALLWNGTVGPTISEEAGLKPTHLDVGEDERFLFIYKKDHLFFFFFQFKEVRRSILSYFIHVGDLQLGKTGFPCFRVM